MDGTVICTDFTCTTTTLLIKVDRITVLCLITISVEEDEKSISLSPQLTPTVNFKLVKNAYLDEPYTPCEESFLADKYQVFEADKIYKKR